MWQLSSHSYSLGWLCPGFDGQFKTMFKGGGGGGTIPTLSPPQVVPGPPTHLPPVPFYRNMNSLPRIAAIFSFGTSCPQRSANSVWFSSVKEKDTEIVFVFITSPSHPFIFGGCLEQSLFLVKAGDLLFCSTTFLKRIPRKNMEMPARALSFFEKYFLTICSLKTLWLSKNNCFHFLFELSKIKNFNFISQNASSFLNAHRH